MRAELVKEHIDFDKVAREEELKRHGERKKLAGHGGDRISEDLFQQGDNVTLVERGNTAAYLAARLKRDHPMSSKGDNIPVGTKSHRSEQVDNINLKTQGGTSAAHLAARLKRDFPEIARAQAKHRKPGRPKEQKTTNGRHLKGQGPNTQERLLRRLARDHP